MGQKVERQEVSKQASKIDATYFRSKVQQPLEKKQRDFYNVKQPSLTRCYKDN